MLFDLEYFYNSTIPDPDRRKRFSNEEDIAKLEDSELIRGCLQTGILSDIGYRHLDYIRDMRNWTSAAHPNQNQLTGLQLVSWLQTCIREVVGKEPSPSAIKVKQLLSNIRAHALAPSDVDPIKQNIALLPPDLAGSLARTIFGMFCDPSLPVLARSNIRLIASSAWVQAPDPIKNEIGMRYGAYEANADLPRRDAAKDFLQAVNGLTYLPKGTLALEIGSATASLFRAHTAFYNFYNEPPYAQLLAKLIPASGQVPAATRHDYVKTVTMCFIGNGYGVSHDAYPYYEELVRKYQDPELRTILLLMQDTEFASRLQFPDCVSRFRRLLSGFPGRTTNAAILAGADFVAKQSDRQLPLCGNSTAFKRVMGI